MRLTGFVCANTRNHWKTLREIFDKRYKQNLLISKEYQLPKYKLERGRFFHFACRGTARSPAPPSTTPLDAAIQNCLDFGLRFHMFFSKHWALLQSYRNLQTTCTLSCCSKNCTYPKRSKKVITYEENLLQQNFIHFK